MPNTTNTTYTFTGLNPSAQYKIIVKAKDLSGNVSTGAEIIANTEAAPVANEVTGLVEATSINAVKLTWNKPTDPNYSHIRILRDGVEIANNITSITYTDYGLASDTTYTYTIIPVNTSGTDEPSSDIIVTTSLDASGITEELYLDGTDDYLQTPSLTYTKVVFDYQVMPSDNNGMQLVFRAPDGTIRAGSNDHFFGLTGSEIYSNGVLAVHNTNFIPFNTRSTLEIRYATAKTQILQFFGEDPAILNTKGYLYDIKIYNGETLVAHYDMSTGTVNDQSGNGNHATLYGGTWASSIPSDKISPQEISGVSATSDAVSVTLNWTNPIDADFSHVRIYRNGVEHVNNTTSNPFRDDIDITDNTTYEYRLTTVDTSGNESAGVLTSSTTKISTVPPGPVSDISETHTHTSITLNWINPTDIDFSHVLLMRNNVEIANNITTGTYTDSGLEPDTTYTYKLIASDIHGYVNTGKTFEATTGIDPANSYKLFMDGLNDYLTIPSGVSHTKIVLDVTLMPNSATARDMVVSSPAGAIQYGQGTMNEYIFWSGATVLVNGVAKTHNTNFLLDNTKQTIEVSVASARTTSYNFFVDSWGTAQFGKGYIHDIKLYDGETLVSHYDLSKKTLIDQINSNYTATLSGGTWLLEEETYTDIASPVDVNSLQAVNVTETDATLQWAEKVRSIDFAAYDIYQDAVLIGSTTNKTYTITNLSPDTLYEFSVISRDTTGNQSNEIKTKTYTSSTFPSEIPVVTDSLVMNADFTNREGRSLKTLYDTVNNIPVTFPTNALYDNIRYGFIDERGFKVYTTELSADTAIGSMTGIDATKGFTVTVGTYDLRRLVFLFENADGTSKLEYSNSGMTLNYSYIDTLGATKSVTVPIFDAAILYHIETNTPKALSDALFPSGELNIITAMIKPTGAAEVIVNGYKITKAAPVDFGSSIDILSQKTLKFMRHNAGGSSSQLRNVAIYNKILTYTEWANNYDFYKSTEPFSDVTINPESFKLAIGASSQVYVQAKPQHYTNLLTVKYDSGNYGYASVDASGMVTGVGDGETYIEVTASYGDQTFTKYIDTAVGIAAQDETPVVVETKSLQSVHINRKIDQLEVGKSFSVMATVFPFDVMDSNIVTWESSNPAVCSVTYGVLDGIAPGTATLTAYDKTKTYSASFDITIIEPIEEIILETDIYTVVPADYSISIDNTNPSPTTVGIQSALDYASINGYRKIVFPLGTYLLNPLYGKIVLPTNMIVDFSGSTINIEKSTKTATGYVMFEFDKVENTKLTNANIYGEGDFVTMAESVEGCISVLIIDALNSGLDNCTVSKSPGFNIITGNTMVKTGTTGTNVSKINFEAGNIADNGLVDNSITANHFRTISYLNISGLGDYYMFGYNQGYFGYAHIRSRLYSIYFYDEKFDFLEAQKFNLQFYSYDKPTNAKYAKIVIYQEVAPTSEDSDFNASAFLRTPGMPRQCFIRNCTIENNKSTGLAMCGGVDWIIEDNLFSGNNGRLPGCDIDWEDGWELMNGDIVRRNTFNSNKSLIFCAGSNFAVYNNTFNASAIYSWARTNNYRVYDNTFNGKSLVLGNNFLGCQADSVYAKNRHYGGITFSTSINHTGAKYKVHVIDNISL